MKCPECNKEISDGAKFCQYCGAKIAAASSKAKNETLDLKLNADEIAAYFSQKNIASYDSYSSVNIPEGVFAFAFTKNGNIAINSGFNEFSKTQGNGGIIGGLKKLISSESNASIALVKKAVFPLSFSFANLELSSAFFDIDAQLLCRVNDGKLFLESFLSDSSSVGVASVEETVFNLVKKVLTDSLYEKSAEEILKGKSVANEVFNSLKEKFKSLYPCFELVELSQFEARNENLSSIKKSSEDFEAETKHRELEKQRQASAFESFQTSNQFEQEYKKIQHENALSEMERETELKKTNLENASELEKTELSNRIEKQKIQDSYDNERFSKKLQQDKEEMQNQMELLQQALKIRNARKDADAERDMMLREQEMNFELEKLRIQNEGLKIQNDEKIRSMQEEARLKDAESKSKDEKSELIKEQNNDYKKIISEQIKTLGEKKDW
ncbi:zinc-ribbon domain-containing protein [Treponema zioleckii]|uniref:zinc-ribbon domain-containing protein n=1 Tax=Treponema zioleckii TaxID=331680 RepID=UPI00168B0546|nr:zinc-ribbon domain-containing protein [Treponema zioleckii]